MHSLEGYAFNRALGGHDVQVDTVQYQVDTLHDQFDSRVVAPSKTESNLGLGALSRV